MAAGTWQNLGARVGHSVGEKGAMWSEAYAPSVAMVAGTPYVGWYEGGGYGWAALKDLPIRSSVFVAHWDGRQWVLDANQAMPNGGLNTAPSAAARTPALASVAGKLYVAWIETPRIPDGPTYNVIVVKRLVEGQWQQVGREIRAQAVDNARILDLGLAGVDGVPFIVWSEAAPGDGGRPSVHVASLSGNRWTRKGKALNVSRRGYANFVAIAGAGTVPYVAWQERMVAGNYQIYVKRWNNSDWSAVGGSLNVNSGTGEAGRPALAVDAARIWLAWTESPSGQRPGLFARVLEADRWTDPKGPLNADPAEGAADTPVLAATPQGAYIAWAEKGLPPATKQVYVRNLLP
jgi:hypothetical protein